MVEATGKGLRKHERGSTSDDGQELKRLRTTNDIPSASRLPTPLTNESSGVRSYRDGTATPPEGRPSQIAPSQKHMHEIPPAHFNSQVQVSHTAKAFSQLESPPIDTQPFSQLTRPQAALAEGVEDEDREGVWGYLIPLDTRFGETMVLKRRAACPAPKTGSDFGRGSKRRTKNAAKSPDAFSKEEEQFEQRKMDNGLPGGGYLVGRHRECDRMLDLPTISNRHCLIFNETKDGGSVAILQDLSSNGTFVNEAIVGRNQHRELKEGDEIAILDQTRFIFRYPSIRDSHGFRRQYQLLDQLGRGHFATVYLCVEKSTGDRYAVKKFEKRPGEPSKMDGLKQEIAVLMSVSHPNVLCLKDSFDEADGVYIVLELAAEGELFNWIVMKQKLAENDARKIFIQLFQGIMYLHERGIVHRDIKPENILLVDKELSLKLADFGLAKIIGEASFTTTLCGTPSYVAPEILENSKKRRYTRAVDVWSLGVVLYICLCGFPPFSDELYSPENPYTLSQQIKMGRFDYPSPYWDSVGDPALDLIDRMLTVDFEKRATIEECLEHPWITQRGLNPGAGESMDSTDGLTGAIKGLDFSKRKYARERTLLSSLNSVSVSKVIPDPPVKVWDKNDQRKVNTQSQHPNGTEANEDAQPENGESKHAPPPAEEAPDALRKPDEFMELGGKGDQPLFGDDAGSRYATKPGGS